MIRVLRYLALAVWAVALLAYCVVLGIPIDRPAVLFWVGTGLLAASIGRRTVRTLLIDFLPFALLLVGYDFLRGLASKLGMPTHWHLQLDADKAMFGGTEPNAWLQQHLKYPTAQWWEVPVVLVYLSYFFMPVVVAGVLWLRGRRGFWQWTYRFVPQCLIGFTFFALAPTAPPWAAARCSAADVASRTANPPCISQAPARTRGGLIGRFPADHRGASPYVQRLTSRALDYLHFHPADSLLHTGQATSDQVAAVPSLHSAGAMLFAIFMWPRVRPPVRVLLVAYPVAMGFVLVYTGEHYVTDVLLGWLVAAVVSIVAALLERRFAARRTPQRQPGEVDTAGVA